MHRCLDLASRGRGKVGNGALVGSVLVHQGTIIAEAWHEAYGAPHAERALLEGFGGKIEPEDVLYVNLEPCAHHGKTPPCTDIIIERGLKHVIYGMVDPDQRVAGRGIEALQNAGIEVGGPSEKALCEYLNKGYLSLRRQQRPWITLKKAQDLSGFTAKPDGSRLLITTAEQDAWSHTFLRARHDAILVGIGTVLRDDPHLNIRFDQNTRFAHSLGLNEILKNEKNSMKPYKIILDSSGRLPLEAKVLRESPERTIVCIGLEADQDAAAELRDRGVIVWQIPVEGESFAWEDFWRACTTPAGEFPGIASILVEGGPTTWAAFKDSGFIDEEAILVGSPVELF